MSLTNPLIMYYVGMFSIFVALNLTKVSFVLHLSFCKNVFETRV